MEEVPWKPLVIEYRELFNSSHTDHVESGSLRYVNGHTIPCLLHYFRSPSSYDAALWWFQQAAAVNSSHILKILGLVDRRNLPYPCIIVVTEYCRQTLKSWVGENTGSLVENDGFGYHLTTRTAHIFRSLFEASNYLRDQLLSHGNINMDTVFMDDDGAVKLGMFGTAGDVVSDAQQVTDILREMLPADLIPYDVFCLVGSIVGGNCWTRRVPTDDWRVNNAILATKHPAFKTATFKLKQRENTYYRLARLEEVDLTLYRLVRAEMKSRMSYLLRDSNFVKYDWLEVVSELDYGHYFEGMLDKSKYYIADPLSFAKFGRHFKVHKDSDMSDSAAEYELENIIQGYHNTMFEVLSGFGIDIDEYGE